jgi:hypothetical protein
MRGSWTPCASGATLTFLLLAASAAQAGVDGNLVLAAQSPKLVQTLREEKVVLDPPHGSSAHATRAFVIFEQPVDRVFELLSQSWRQREYRPEIESIETVAELGDGTVDEHHMRIMFVEIQYRLRNHRDPSARRLSWELDPAFDNDLERVEGSWELFPFEGGRTLGVFGTVVEVSDRMPSFLQDYATRKNLPGTLERCRRWVDAGGRASHRRLGGND